MGTVQLWKWLYTDDSGKRRMTRYLLTEQEAAGRLREPVKVPESMEERKPLGNTSDWLKRP
jgi:hypothetical protein